MLKIMGDHAPNTVEQMWRCLATGSAVRGVLCADGHLGYSQPVGGVVAYEKHISVSGVGFDIGCGNLAAKLDITHAEIKGRIDAIAKSISRKIDFGLGGRYEGSRRNLGTGIFDDHEAWHAAGVGYLKDMAVAQLGTVGGGNHYVDLFEDRADGHVWIGVHFGSRGLGHKTAARYLKFAGGHEGIDAAPALVSDGSELGQRYIAAMTLAGRYAQAGRDWVVDVIRRLLAARIIDRVHNHHNYAWAEEHDGRLHWVVRKGATPAFPGQRGFIGGSMGDDAVIVEGTDSPQSREALYSTVHGAGRLFGRRDAKLRFTRHQMNDWMAERGIHLAGGDVDESPMAYRRLDDVLPHHEGTIRVTARLRPFLVMMAGPDVRDPYKE